MVTTNQADYFKYEHMFRGSAYKGASVLKGMLNDPTIGPGLVTTPAAVSAIFTDASRSSIDALCCDALATTSYYDTAINTYLSNTGKTDNILGIINDTSKMLAYERNVEYNTAIEKCPTYSLKCTKRKASLTALMETVNTDVASKPAIKNMIATTRKSVASTIDMNAAINTWSTSNSTFIIVSRYQSIYVSKFDCVLIGVGLKNKAGDKLYAGILRYTMSTGVVSLCMVSNQSGTFTETSNYTQLNACIKPVYDSSDDRVYMFYTAIIGSTNAAWYCAGIITATIAELVYSARDINCGDIQYEYRYNAGFVYAAGSANNGTASFAWNYSYPTIYYCVVSPNAVTVRGTGIGNNDLQSGYGTSGTLNASLTAYHCYPRNDGYNPVVMRIGLFSLSGNRFVITYFEYPLYSSYANVPYSAVSPIPGMLLLTYYVQINGSSPVAYTGHKAVLVMDNGVVGTFDLVGVQPLTPAYVYYDPYSNIFTTTVSDKKIVYKNGGLITNIEKADVLDSILKTYSDYIYSNPGGVMGPVDKMPKEYVIKSANGYNLNTVLSDTIV
jgi:hypothetical protein